MLNLKKTAVAVLALSSGAVFAGTMGPVCSAVNVTVPCESTAWELGAQALYLQTNVGGDTNGLSRTITTAPGESATLGQNPRYGWGFMVEGAYHFSTGNDVNLNWYHIANGYSKNAVGSRTVSVDNFLANPLPRVAGDSTTYQTIGGTIDPQWDAVNLEMGQHVDFGENKSIRFHGGVEYARLTGNATISTSGVYTDPNAPIPVTNAAFSNKVSTNPSYNGFGPRLGSDMTYDWGNGLGFYANGAAALLAGSSKTSTTFANLTNGTSVRVNSSATIVVPELEAKLGATYSYAMAQGDLTFDIGWMWVNYFNPIRSQGHNLNDNGETGNFGLEGPFVGLKWMGNVA